MILYNMARKINAGRKKYLKHRSGLLLSPVRRIEQVYPTSSERYVAMTFDDGPDALPPDGRSKGLTSLILDTLSEYGAHVTFDVIGSTAPNYPDEEGAPGDFTWSGVAFDHYPVFGKDELAGAKNQPDLIRRIITDGHEIANHGSTHRLFGKMRSIYKSRHHFNTLAEVVDDLDDLHKYMEQEFDYKIKLGRPAHYIDNIPDGASAYDAYRIMGYNYVAAGFDGAGWQPRDSYKQEVSDMIKPMESALSANPDALNGKIIFQKDGCNMALRTPVADALPKQLKLLKEYGYKVVSVSELLDISAFEDLDPDSEAADAARILLSANHVTGYKNNTFHPERNITVDEIALMLCKPAKLRQHRKMTQNDLFAVAAEAAGFKSKRSEQIGKLLLNLADKAGVNTDEQLYKDRNKISRADAVLLISKIISATQ